MWIYPGEYVVKEKALARARRGNYTATMRLIDVIKDGDWGWDTLGHETKVRADEVVIGTRELLSIPTVAGLLNLTTA